MKLTKSLKVLCFTILVVAFASGCNARKDGGGAGGGNADEAIKAASAAIAKAKANKWIWRDTEKMLKKAKAAKAKGDSKKAAKLANMAKAQAELAMEQYQKESKMDRGLK